MSSPIVAIGPVRPPRPPRSRTPLLRQRYSRFVGLMKVILPAVAAALLGLVVVWPRLTPHRERMNVDFSQPDAARVDALSIRNPKYYGTDQGNLPFTVTADVATQLDPQNLVVTLEKPVADMARADGRTLVVNSDIGFYRQKDDTLDLVGHVDMYRDDGFELHSDSARVMIAKGDATGDEPAQAQGPGGTLEGEGFNMKDHGRTVIFTGHSKAVLTVGPHKTGS
jgi:lipopolysaccharide export system protein LptC